MEDAAVSGGSLGKLPLEVGVWDSLGLVYPEGTKQWMEIQSYILIFLISFII